MQQSFFPPVTYRSDALITSADRQRISLERSDYNRWYCIKEILYEQYLWDMRCWHKPKFQYTKAEVMEHIKKWIIDHEAGNWTNNCGHCLYCMKKLLQEKACTLEEIAEFCLKNNFIKYGDQIGTWNNGTDEFTTDIKQTSDC